MGTESHDVTIVWVSALESMPIHSQDSLQDLRVEERKRTKKTSFSPYLLAPPPARKVDGCPPHVSELPRRRPRVSTQKAQTSHHTPQNFPRTPPCLYPQGSQVSQITRLSLSQTRRGPSDHTRTLESCSWAAVSLGPRPAPRAPPPGSAGGRRGRGRGRRAGGGAEGGPRPRAGARRGPGRCRCRRPERLQLQRRGRRQRGQGGGLRRGPARSRDYGGAERPLQDCGGGGRGVRQDGAAAGVRQGRLPRGEEPTSCVGGAEAEGVGDWGLGDERKWVLG